nr:hypothetical protein Iba_chr14fCG1770 [Ipomoea batatas]
MRWSFFCGHLAENLVDFDRVWNGELHESVNQDPHKLCHVKVDYEALLHYWVQRVRPHERREIPRLRPRRAAVAEVGHVEEARAAARGEENLLLVRRVAVGEEAVDEHERLQRHHPVARLAQTPRDGADASSHVRGGVAREGEDLAHVPLIRREVLVACGFDDGDF